jgi:hypothetical protein
MPGRPTKKSPQTIAKILKIARTGMPLYFAASAGNISLDTLMIWKRQDPELNKAIEQARLIAARSRWERITKGESDDLFLGHFDLVSAARGYKENPPDWKADAWMLERCFAQLFSRPEVQINLQNNTQVNVGNEFVISVKGAEMIENRTRELDVEVEQMFEDRERSRE